MSEPTPDLAAIVEEAEHYGYVIRAIDQYEGPTGDDLLPAIRAALASRAEWEGDPDPRATLLAEQELEIESLKRRTAQLEAALRELNSAIWTDYPQWAIASPETYRATMLLGGPADQPEDSEGG